MLNTKSQILQEQWITTVEGWGACIIMFSKPSYMGGQDYVVANHKVNVTCGTSRFAFRSIAKIKCSQLKKIHVEWNINKNMPLEWQ